MKKLILSFALLLLVSGIVYTQDTILLMNGQYRFGKIDLVNKQYVKINIIKNKKIKSKLIDREDIFSVIDEQGNENVLYFPDSIYGHDISQIQMKYYIQGVQDARNTYCSPLTSIGGFMIGITGGIYGFWGSILPTSYVFISGAKTPKCEDQANGGRDIEYIASEVNLKPANGLSNISEVKSNFSLQYDEYESMLQDYYQLGYKEKAKDKKVKNAMKGTIAGFITTIVVSFIIAN